MTTQIIIHLLPQEIDWFEWQIKQLKQGSYYIEEDSKIIIDVTLNLNLVEWNKSQIPKQFFIDKFLQIEKLCDWCETQFIIDEENKCLGCNDKRRESIKTSKSDNIIYLDCDLIFPKELLKVSIDSSKLINNEYYVISPQIIKLWDNSWDDLVNQNYINQPPSQNYRKTDPYSIISTTPNSLSLIPINQFKFGGGWFNLFSTKLLQKITIPPELGSYGMDDTFIMVGCKILKNKGNQIQQYVLENMVVSENIKYRWDPYKNYLSLIDKVKEFRDNSNINFQTEIEKLINKL